MDKLNDLNEIIADAWLQIQEAANNQDWPATQQAFRKMAMVQDISDQSRVLQERIAGLSSNADPVKPPIERQSGAAVFHLNGRRRQTVRPKELRLGTHHIAISLSNQIPIATANWILKQGKPLPRIENFVHPTDSGFARSAQRKPLDDGSYIEVGDHQEILVQKARRLLNECGFRNVKLEVLLEDGTSKTG